VVGQRRPLTGDALADELASYLYHVAVRCVFERNGGHGRSEEVAVVYQRIVSGLPNDATVETMLDAIIVWCDENGFHDTATHAQASIDAIGEEPEEE
jgi:hypothetical protein